MFVPLLVQTNELRERPRSRSIPALPGRLTIGALQLKLRESRSSPDVPTRFSGAINAIGQFSSCVGGGAIDDEMFTAVIGAGPAATTFGMPGVRPRTLSRLGKLLPGGPCLNWTLGFSSDLPAPIAPGTLG